MENTQKPQSPESVQGSAPGAPVSDTAPQPAPQFRTIVRRPPAWLNSLRAALGMRPLPPVTIQKRVPDGLSAAQEEAERAALRAAVPYMVAALVFAGLVVMGFIAYGMMARRAPVIEAGASDPLILQALARLEAGDKKGARELRDRARQESPNDPLVWFFDGFLRVGGGEVAQDEITRLERQAASGRQRLQAMLRLAGIRQAKGDGHGSAELLRRAVQLEPRNLRVRLLRATVLMTSGQFTEVVEEANELEQLEAPPGAFLGLRGRAYLALGKHSEARRDLQGALAHSPHALPLRLALAESCWELNDLKQAAAQLGAVLKEDAKNADAHMGLGIVFEKAGNTAAAEAAYRRAVQLNPKLVPALNNLAYLLAVTKKRPREALDFARRAHDLAPHTPAVADTLGWTLHLLGNYGEALPLLRRAAAGDPANPDIRWHLAQALLAAGETQEGMKLVRELADSPVDSPVRRQARARLRVSARPGPVAQSTGKK